LQFVNFEFNLCFNNSKISNLCYTMDVTTIINIIDTTM
jgi:hypothetical protein